MRFTFYGLLSLVICFAAASTAFGQFTITIPKIPKIKNERPATRDESPKPTPTASSDDSSDLSSMSSASSSAIAVRGRPISGARITFSNSPDGSNPKTSFSSSEYIYGRLDLGGRTVYDAFGLKNQGADAKFYYINYDLEIWKPGEKPWEDKWSGNNYTLVSKEDAQKTYWNFDVLPEPSKVSTLRSAIADELEYYKGVAGIYGQWYDADSARRTFPQNGTYTIDITLFGNSYDDWGKTTGKIEEYPTASAQFAFQFSGSDGQTLIANATKARDSLEAAKNRREMLHAMPDWWARGKTPPDPKLSAARLTPMIKGFIGKWNLTYVKHTFANYTGPLWVIEKDDYNLPEYRMVVPYIYVLYKEPKDNSCQIGALYMRESYAGGGRYGEPYLGGIRDIQYIDCAAVK